MLNIIFITACVLTIIEFLYGEKIAYFLSFSIKNERDIDIVLMLPFMFAFTFGLAIIIDYLHL